MSAIPRHQLDDIHALSPVQQGMFFHAMLEPELAPYVTQSLWRIHGVVVPELFERTWNELVARHTVLRSVFRQARRQPVQIVLKHRSIGIPCHDWTSRPPEEQRRALDELARSEHAPFRLADGPLFRLALVRLGADEWRLLWTFHHIILDGLTAGLLLESLCAIYGAVASGQPLPPADSAPFSRFIVWLAQQDQQEGLRFWAKQLEGVETPTLLPYDRRPTSVAGRTHRARHAWVSRETTRALEDLARRQRVTLSRLVHAAWALLLSRYSGASEVVFGLTLAGRPADVAGVERIAGPFINTVPVRVSLSGDPRLADLLQTLQRQFFEIEPYSYVSVADIQSRTPITPPAKLFDSAINVHPPVDWNGFRSSAFELGVAGEQGPPVGRTNFGLMVDVVLFETIGITISYVEEAFDDSTIVGLLACLRTLLDAVASHGASARVSELDPLSPDERTRLLELNRPDPAIGFEGGVVARIEAQVAATPQATAVVANDGRLSYEALNVRANRVAWWLRAAGIGREDRVGVFGERGAELLAVLLGILKAGAAFVPLDPMQPDARLASMLSAATLRVVACGPDTAARALALASSIAQAPAVVCWGSAPPGLAVDDAKVWARLPVSNPPRVTGARDLACIFFTSGSTGTPKGVMVEHAGMLNHHAAKAADFGIDASSVVAQNAALGFDVSVWQMLVALERGGRVAIYDDETAMDAPRLVAGVARDGVTILETVPALLDSIADAARGVELPSLTLLVSNAELLPVPLCRRWLEGFPHVPLVNTYGATECSDDTTHHVQRDLPGDDASRIAVGRPIPGARIYVVDRALRLVPCGARGEIAMAGVAVGRGYLGDPARTALAFVPDPYSTEPGTRMYLSGDTGRWTRRGLLEFTGRDGDQVKVRGHRIELGEIQAALLAQAGVRQAAAIVSEGASGEPQILAYWAGADEVDPARLRAALAAALPAHMLPAALVRIEALPLTPHGKVDRRALPVPSAGDRQASYVAPSGAVEIQVAEIWREVLGVEQVGATDNFFELGGQSLKTLQIRLRLVEAFGVDIPMRDVFRHQTVQEQARVVAEAVEKRTEPFAGIPRLPDADTYALSRAQRRLWFVHQLDPADTSYNLLEPLSLEGAFDLSAFERAWSDLVARHESLRTTFVEIDGEPVQRIAPPAALRLPHLDLAGLPEPERASRLRRALTGARETPFTLETPPVRPLIVTLAPERHLFAVALHHLVSDGWSGDVLLRELLELYRAARAGDAPRLPPLPIRYVDYAAWQNQRIATGGFAGDEQYWTATLAGDLPALDLAARPVTAPAAGRTHTRSFAIEAETVEGLRRATADLDLTPFMLRLALVKAALARLTGAGDLLIGAPVAGRDRPESDALVGFFVNLLLFRTSLAGDPSFLEAAARVRQSCLEAYAHQDYPFDELVQRLNPARRASRVPIVDILFTTFASGGARTVDGLTIAESASGRDPAMMMWPGATMAVALFVICREEPDGTLSWMLVFDAQRVDAETVERVTARFEALIRAIARGPQARLSTLPIVGESERDLVVREWNTTATPFPAAATVHALVEARVAEAPDALAVIHGDERWTYGAINARANRLARHLLAKGVEPGTLVGTILERSSDLVVAQLAILKAGAAYMSLAPDDPRERLRFMLVDAEIHVAIAAQPIDAGLLEAGGISWVILDRDAPELASLPGDDLPRRGHGRSLSHVMYTSGSTGRPKGVMIPHRGITRLVRGNPALAITPADGVAQIANCQFDGATLEIWGALVNGARLVIIPRETVLAPAALAAAIAAHGITIATLTPVLFNQMARETPACFRRMKYLFSGGDVMSPVAARQVLEHGAPAHLLNGYGPTENTMFTTCHLVTPATAESPAIPIGRPVGNTQVYIVDTALEPVGVGMPGELCAGGAGLADGYWGRPALTAETFIPNPFSGVPGSRLYCTGDLARWGADGSIEFLGRADHQVKIRGHRIELGEVEAVLMEHGDVAAAVAVVRETGAGDRHLAVYVVPAPGAAIAADALRRFVSARLPGYMVPTWVVPLTALPLTSARKVDRQALPAPTDDRALLGVEYVPPRTAVEAQIAGVWSDVLGRAPIGVRDNFFDLGGHSLTTVLVRSRLCERFEIDLPLRAVFEHQTIEAQARAIEALAGRGLRAPRAQIARQPERDHYRLSHAQRRLWFLQRLHPQDTTYTVFVPVPLDGPLDTRAFARALEGLVARHATLRTRFALAGQEPVQCIAEEIGPPLQFHDLSELGADARRERSRAIAEEMGGTAFDLSRPAIRTALVKLSDVRHLFFLALHHSLTDGWSWRVLVRDLAELYRAARHGEEPALEPLPIRYVDYAAWQNERIESGALGAAEQYWLERLADAPPALELPDESPPADASIDEMRAELFVSGAASVERLHTLGQTRELAPLMARLALVDAFLARATGQEDLVVGVPVTGRDHPDTEGLVGFFVNILPMRTNLEGDPTFLEVLDRVRQTCLEAYTHQEYPFDLLVQRLNPSRDPDQLPFLHAVFTSDRAAPPVVVDDVSVGAPADLPVDSGGMEWRGTANGIRITCFEQGARLIWSLAYPASRLSVASARRLMRQFAGFIEDVVRAPEAPLSRIELRPEYGLSAAQRDAWLDCRARPAAAVAAGSIRVALRGPLDADRWRSAYESTIHRADALRASFHESDGAVIQQIAPHVLVDLPLVDLASIPGPERDCRLQQIERELASRPFDPASAPLVRAVLVRLEEAQHVWLVSAHRLVIDATGLPRLVAETALAYEGTSDSRPPGPQYSDFVAWQEGRARSGMFAPHAQHWRRQLQPPLPPMALPAERLAPSSRTFEAGIRRRHVDAGVALAALASRPQMTVEAALVAVFAVLVARLTGQPEIVAGLRVSSCPKWFDGVLGAFTNTLPLRLAVGAGGSFQDLVRDADARLREARNRREAPLAGVTLEQEGGRPAFTVAIECVELLDRSSQGARMLMHPPVPASAAEELVLMILETSDGFDLALRYPVELFDAATIARWADALVTGLARAAGRPEVSIGRLDLLPDAEREWLVHGVNAAAAPPAAATGDAAVVVRRTGLHQEDRGSVDCEPRIADGGFQIADCAVHALVEAQAAQAPDALAVIHGDERWTYGALNDHANRVARYLAARGVEPGTLVGTFLERSPALVVAHLAILKAGAAYLPLSPADPADRVAFMLADARARIVITTEALGAGLTAATDLTVVALDRDAAAIAACSCRHLPVRGGGNSLAYVMYTSGSTGRPKGVMIPHRGITRLVRDTRLVTIAPTDRVAVIANCSFDAATFEVWGALVNGACLVSFPHETVMSPRELAAGFETHGVTVAFFTAALFSQMAMETPASFSRMRHLLTGGDVMNARATRLILERGAPGRLSNGYGPTENSVFTTEHTVTLAATELATIPIGHPISHTQVYVVDAELQPVGVGLSGELCTGGAGVADGYWDRPALTAERFIPDPFSGVPGARLYCTGDLARWRADGSIEFLGRRDRQVKIRGHRVELGEIEAVLRQHHAIADAVVVMRDRGAGAQGLTGYVVPAPGAAIAPDALRRYLGTHLPGYMVPAWIVPLATLPLAATGKVDRRALPAPDEERPALDVERTPPRNALEAEVAAVWSEVLRVERVGIHDDFFDLGGDSVQCIVAVSHLAERGIHTTPKRFYAHSTVAGLAGVAERTSASAREDEAAVSGPVPLLPIQQFFFEQELQSSHHWNAGTLLRAERLEEGAVERALQAILDHHDALRMRFSHGPEGWTQHNPAPGEAVCLEVIDLGEDGARLNTECTRIQASLDFVKGPVFRAGLFRLADGTDRLLVVAHHLVSDMVSGRILYEDLQRAYEQALRGAPVELRSKTTSYRRWAQILGAHAPERLEELPYWQSVAGDAAACLPIDCDLGDNSMESVEHVRLEIDAETTHTLLTRARQALGLEMHDLLFAALSRALGEWAGVPALAFLVEGHGREDIADGADLSRTVGWFTAMYPVRLETGRGMERGEHLRRVRETLRAVPGRGLGYGLLRYTLRRPEVAGRRQPEVTFNYHGQFSVPPGSRFGVARESAGEFTGTRGRRFSLLNAECWVGSGRLRAAFLYSRHKHRPETLAAVLERFAQELRAIAGLCLETPRGTEAPGRRAPDREHAAAGV